MKIRNLTAFTSDDGNALEIVIRDRRRKVHRATLLLPIDLDDLPHKLSMAGFQLVQSLKREKKP